MQPKCARSSPSLGFRMRGFSGVMESPDTYLDRKYEELKLLNGFLDAPLSLRRPASVDEVIQRKFQIAAALKSEHALHDWAHTETAWTHASRMHAGLFEFKYDYQRADLEVRGPSIYPMQSIAAGEIIYTSSGMAAMSALLLASRNLVSEADILVLPGSYGETSELIESHVRHLRVVRLERLLGDVPASRRPKVLLFDSCVPAEAYESTLNCLSPHLDLIVFDTTCFSVGSGRIRRVLRWAQTSQIPIVLVRSHTKLDSLGVEYGRLGSIVFVTSEDRRPMTKERLLQDFARETRNAVRLFGGAAIPAHFPPFVGAESYRALTNKRIAAILRNCRGTARYFTTALPGATAELHFAHGLYVMLASDRALDEQEARQVATDLSDDLSKVGLPVRHAGSFGFDFVATEWCYHRPSSRYVVRIAVADLATSLWDQVAQAVAQWWVEHEQRRGRQHRVG